MGEPTRFQLLVRINARAFISWGGFLGLNAQLRKLRRPGRRQLQVLTRNSTADSVLGAQSRFGSLDARKSLLIPWVQSSHSVKTAHQGSESR